MSERPPVSPPRSRPESRPGKVLILIERAPRCHWHEDCDKASGKQGILRPVKDEPEYTLFECMHCGKKGKFPVAGKFGVAIYCEEAE